MRERVEAIAAVTRADFLIRFRRWSTAVVFLILAALAYVWIPAPSTGRSLIVISGQRTLNNSPTIALGTAVIGTLFVGLIGFYVISNAIQRDARSRCGFIIAATGVRSVDYLLGKFVGNVVFLVTFMAGFMITSMVMVVVRGEAALEPGTFLLHYAVLTIPAVSTVSMLAITFESVPFLSGRIGDVFYFFVWVAGLGVPVAAYEMTGAKWIQIIDVSGLMIVIDRIEKTMHTASFSIGASDYDPTKPPFDFQGITFDWGIVWMRTVAFLIPLVLLPLALLFFHRFDPARIRKALRDRHSGRLARLNMLLKPVTRLLDLLRPRAREGRVTLWIAARHDAVHGLRTIPVAVIVLLGLVLAEGVTPIAELADGILPIAFLALAIMLADHASREARTGVWQMIYTAPLLKKRFVAWKLLGALIISGLILGVPVARLLVVDPLRAVALLTGIFFVATLAISLGILSSNPKTFIVVFLMLWYITLNDKGETPALDFAGFFHVEPSVVGSWAAIGAGLAVVAAAAHAWRLHREGM